MSREQAAALTRLLREGPLDLGGDLAEQRPLLQRLMTAHPLPSDVRTYQGESAGVPVVEIVPDGPLHGDVLLFFHGGAYALGSAGAVAGLVSEIVTRTGLLGVSVEYRLAPEHPFPAALDDAVRSYRGLLESGIAAERIVVGGESAGAGLALALLLRLGEQGLGQPAAAVLFSPWADLTLSGATLASKAEADPALDRSGLQRRALEYLAGAEPHHPHISPVLADLTGLPPLLIQVGSAEVLLSDALRLAARAAEDDVSVTLEVAPFAPHVFQGFSDVYDEAATALDSAARFLTTRLELARRPSEVEVDASRGDASAR